MVAVIIHCRSCLAYTPGCLGLLSHWRQSYLPFPALLPVNSNDPASLSLSDIDCFMHFLGFVPRHFFSGFWLQNFLLSQNRQKYSFRSTCWWQFFCRTLIVSQAGPADHGFSCSWRSEFFNLCSVTIFICYFWPFGMEWSKIYKLKQRRLRRSDV